MKKQDWYQGEVKFEELAVGQKWLNIASNQLDEITRLTSNSIEIFVTADEKKFFKTGQLNSDGEVETKKRLKGVSHLNWYELSQFNRAFKKP